MTAMPQLVAAFHSLVGLAAVFVAAAALSNPAEFGITDADGRDPGRSRLEMGLGVIIGAITFSGSVIAFAQAAGADAQRADPAARASRDQRPALGAADRASADLFIAARQRRSRSG